MALRNGTIKINEQSYFSQTGN